MIYCGECHSKILISSRRKKDGNCYTICSGYRKNKLCSVHSNNYDKLENVIISKIYNYIISNIDVERVKINVINKLNYKRHINKKDINRNYINNKIMKLNDNLDRIYLDKINNLIDEEQYNRLSNIIKNKINYYNEELNRKNNLEDNNINISSFIDNFFNNFYISRSLIVELIHKI